MDFGSCFVFLFIFVLKHYFFFSSRLVARYAVAMAGSGGTAGRREWNDTF